MDLKHLLSKRITGKLVQEEGRCKLYGDKKVFFHISAGSTSCWKNDLMYNSSGPKSKCKCFKTKLVLAHSLPIFWLLLFYPFYFAFLNLIFKEGSIWVVTFYLHSLSCRNSCPVMQIGTEVSRAWREGIKQMIMQTSGNFPRKGNGWPGIHQQCLQSEMRETLPSLFSYLEDTACQMLTPLWRGTELPSKDEPLSKSPIECLWKDIPSFLNVRHHSVKYQHTQLQWLRRQISYLSWSGLKNVTQILLL